jgi:hypothetical protein
VQQTSNDSLGGMVVEKHEKLKDFLLKKTKILFGCHGCS